MIFCRTVIWLLCLSVESGSRKLGWARLTDSRYLLCLLPSCVSEFFFPMLWPFLKHGGWTWRQSPRFTKSQQTSFLPCHRLLQFLQQHFKINSTKISKPCIITTEPWKWGMETDKTWRIAFSTCYQCWEICININPRAGGCSLQPQAIPQQGQNSVSSWCVLSTTKDLSVGQGSNTWKI